MSNDVPCPSCGTLNPPDAGSCSNCNFPLRAQAPEEAPPGTGSATRTGSEPVIFLRKPVRRQRATTSPQVLSLWLLFAAFAAMGVVWLAIKVNLDRAQQPVEGAAPDQQKRADEFRAALARDSTDVAAHIGLADVLYDTGNWSEAIVHYQAALRRDSTRVTTIVDLGVCYYNLGEAPHAEDLFQLALRHDPHQAVALFNLGIVNEQRSNFDAALRFYHQALESQPPEDMRAPLIDAMKRLQVKTGRTPPPLPDGAK